MLSPMFRDIIDEKVTNVDNDARNVY